MTAGKIPAWQRATFLPGVEEPKAEATVPPPESESKSSDEGATRKEAGLKEQAQKFLQDASIKDASPERKATFLESKGIKREDIEALLGNSSSKTQEAQAPIHQTLSPPSKGAPAAPVRDVPPVITYPEFLVHANKPAPLVTTNLLLNTAYVTAGLYATVYGLSKYIIAPMEASLTQTRHDLLSHTSDQLEIFNSKLSDMVSSVPSSRALMPSTKGKSDHDHPDNVSDITTDSDPTELFHRDFGTQTSPSLSRRTSSSEASSPAAPVDTISGHQDRLKIMGSHLKELEASGTANSLQEDDFGKQIQSLTSYLHDMTYMSPYYRNYSGLNSGFTGVNEDEIDKLKTEIRGVKGVLLSTRNFPRSQKS